MNRPFVYDITDSLHTSAHSRVYRARQGRGADARPVIVKILNKTAVSFQEATRYKREFTIAARCPHPGIAQPLALRFDAGYWTMLQQDGNGDSLDKLIDGGHKPTLDVFFEIALQLCAVLAVVHGKGIIHKDVNPSNLVWNPQRRVLQLIDFGIASELEQEIPQVNHPAALEGTLRYMAPEQTGRMNRVVDYRADYYSMGATFYELLSGQPPFPGADAMELVHSHLAVTPDWSLPALAALPGPLLAIVQRLMEKNAEQRYQGLPGLVRDLALCRSLAQLPRPIQATPFELTDTTSHFLIPQTLIGREHDVATLLSAFAKASTGPAGMLLVGGYSGVGKSVLIHEVHKPIVAQRGFFISGKCDQFRRDVPYAALVQALQELIRQLLCEPERQVRQWASALREALGTQIGVLVALIPDLALIVGVTEAVTALPPVEAQHRLNRLFRRFVDVFSSASHPMVIFLDDLQWVDTPTLALIETVMATPQDRYLLCIGAYRDHEVDADHRLTALRERLQQAGFPIEVMLLAPLDETQVGQLVAETLHVTPADAAALTGLCFKKTRGNPFFLNQFLHTIHEAGQLVYHHASTSWRWDLEAIANTDYTDNVIDLMLEKIRRLPSPARRLLELASCIGNRFDLDTLAAVSGQHGWQTQRDLWPALQAGLVHPLGEQYKYIGSDMQGATQVRYRFLHDRVQQAAYASTDMAARQASHLQIGRELLRHATDADPDAQLFAIVDQFNAGRDGMTDAAELLHLAQLNYRAGVKARGAAAFEAAARHMHIGIALLPDHAWQTHTALMLDLQLGAAETACLCNQFAQAEAIYPLVRAHSTDALQAIRCIGQQASQYQLQGRLPEAIHILRDALGLLGMTVSDDSRVLKAGIADMVADLAQHYGDCDIDALLEAAPMQDPFARATMQMMQRLWQASYYAGQQDLSMTMVVSMTRLSLQQGNSEFTPVAYVAYAFFLSGTYHDRRSYRFGAMALELANRGENMQARVLTGLMFGAMISHWTQPLSSSIALYDDALRDARDSGDFVNVGVVAAVRATDRLILGHYLPDLLQATTRDLGIMRSNGQQDMVDCTIAGALQPARCLMGLTRSTDSYDDDDFSEAGFLARYGSSRLYLAYFYQGKIRNAYLFDSADAEQQAHQRDLVVQILRGQAKVPETTLYAALIWLRQLQRQPQRADADALLERVTALMALLASWAQLNPANHAAGNWLVQAELARTHNDMPLALGFYQQAIDAAHDSGYLHVEALANELCGQFWLAHCQPRVAATFLQEALGLYRRWGADGKVAQLAALHGSLVNAGSGTVAPHFVAATNTTGASGNAALDLASIIKASQALSDEIGLRNVLQHLIAIVRENSGAQVARLLLLDAAVWRVEAEMDDSRLTVLESRVVSLESAADVQFPLSLLRFVVRTGEVIIEDNLSLSPHFSGDPYVQRQQPRSVLCLPIRQGGQVACLLYLENNLTDSSFTAERAEFLRTLGGQAMISIAHARMVDSLELRVAERTAQLEDANGKLATLSATDGLTGLANRRRFDEVLSSEWGRAGRTGFPLAVLMIDVDHFKKFNDCYGHQAGDDCLRRIAAVLQGGTRRSADLAARYGGEEFSIVLANTDNHDALQLAEAVRLLIEQLAMPHAQSPLGKVTISIGVAIHHAGNPGTMANLLRASDDALYLAKGAGRNRVHLSAS
ncbi:diguanylate cyclase [Actimicrobium sp. CCI2.3]|uniref:diguanylate cyclase n=1 Tax=Actimicrobium sp. CCI2.3 TaxID=3048616 RepID=UPI002AB388C7|nr:diguanylate cyclase [Actimicrobium sp. CCI2.3]MDY7574786.1 diguanylate cyclase [Actimicrobium sp. CCI2.3]MEB0020253.1 diguanylate cyclase [Actimicrobium sp. CCI2.3]